MRQPEAAAGAQPPASPGFDYWIVEANRLLETGAPDHAALFCATKATNAAASDIEWARATNIVGVAQFHLGKLDELITVFTSIIERFATSIDADRREWQVRALVNKGVTLGALSRSAEAIAVYDDLLARFGTATELPLREQVAKALVNKGVTLGALNRSAEAIAVYDDLLARFGTATELPLREQVAKALVNKGVRLGALDRSAEEIAVYDDLLARFGTATELPLRELVANALVNKGVRLGTLDRSAEAIAVYDDLLARFGTATELPLRELVALAELRRKAFARARQRRRENPVAADSGAALATIELRYGAHHRSQPIADTAPAGVRLMTMSVRTIRYASSTHSSMGLTSWRRDLLMLSRRRQAAQAMRRRIC